MQALSEAPEGGQKFVQEIILGEGSCQGAVGGIMRKKNVDWVEISKEFVGRSPRVSYAMIAAERNLDPRTVSINIKETLNTALILLEAHKEIK